MASLFSNVTFCDIQELYTIDSAVNVQFVVSSPLRPSSCDSIGLYRIGWISVQNYIGIVQVPAVDEESSVEDNSSTTLNVTFNVKELTVEDGEFYQFCYLSGNSQVRGVSIPFQFVMDDFEIVSEMPCREHPLDSFVHAEPEPVLSTSLVKSAFTESSEISLLQQRILELEEISSRVSAESLNYRQENEKLQYQLHALEENAGKENMQSLQNIESLKKVIDDKNQLLQELTDRNKELECQLAAESLKISNLDISFSALLDAQKQLEERCQKCLREKTTLETERSRLMKDNEHLSHRVAEVTSMLEQTTLNETVANEASAENAVENMELLSTFDMNKDVPPRVSQDVPEDVRSSDEKAINSGVKIQPVNKDLAPHLVDVMDQGYGASTSQCVAARPPMYGFFETSTAPVNPYHQIPVHPYPYAIPRTWFPNPYADYIPEVYRAGLVTQN